MADTPKYVRLAARLQGRTQVDINSGWSISGLDVQEVPDREKYPNAFRFVRSKLNQGVLEPASKAEYEEVEEAQKESREQLQERLEDLAALGVNPTNFGFAVHQERAVQDAARARRERVENARKQNSEEEPDAYEQDKARRKSIIDSGGGDNSDSEYQAWTNDKLRQELEERELPTSGNKQELVARLVQDDSAASSEEDESEES